MHGSHSLILSYQGCNLLTIVFELTYLLLDGTPPATPVLLVWEKVIRELVTGETIRTSYYQGAVTPGVLCRSLNRCRTQQVATFALTKHGPNKRVTRHLVGLVLGNF